MDRCTGRREEKDFVDWDGHFIKIGEEKINDSTSIASQQEQAWHMEYQPHAYSNWL